MSGDSTKKPKVERWDDFMSELRVEILQRLIDVGGIIAKAAELVGVDRTLIYYHMNKDEEFAAEVAEARKAGRQMLKDELYRRVYDGIPEPVYYQGEQCKDVEGNPLFIMRKDTASLKLALCAAFPDEFRERFEHSGPNGNPLLSNVVIYLPDNGRGDVPTADEIEAKAAAKAAAGESTETKTS